VVHKGVLLVSAFDRIVAGCLPIIPKPIVGLVSRRYIAGETLDEALALTRQLNNKGMCATLDVLGEDVNVRGQAEDAASRYKVVLEQIEREKLDSNISVKPTQLGLKLGVDFCHELLRGIVGEAKAKNNFVRIDMEDSSCTSDTVEVYKRLRSEYDNVGLALQSYLRRTLDDVLELAGNSANFRICKGIYNEPRTIAYKDRDLIRKNYSLAMETAWQAGSYVAVATHDEWLVWEALRLIEQLKLDGTRYEFQMLLGVDEEMRGIIVDAGHRLRVYVPFGKAWYAYSMRRLKENPKIAGYVAKSFLRIGP
jgi:proline dehydrogenase